MYRAEAKEIAMEIPASTTRVCYDLCFLSRCPTLSIVDLKFVYARATCSGSILFVSILLTAANVPQRPLTILPQDMRFHHATGPRHFDFYLIDILARDRTGRLGLVTFVIRHFEKLRLFGTLERCGLHAHGWGGGGHVLNLFGGPRPESHQQTLPGLSMVSFAATWLSGQEATDFSSVWFVQLVGVEGDVCCLNSPLYPVSKMMDQFLGLSCISHRP